MTTIRKFILLALFFANTFLSGCVAALPVVAGLAVAGAAAGIYTFVNLARDQYPDIDFDKPAPVVVIYKSNFDKTWNAVVDTLMEMKESSAMMDRSSGVIRTNKKNLNDVSWIGKGLGKASFLYELNITVRNESNGVSVASTIPFWEEKMFIAAKEKNVPEGSNMMRHIFYQNLNKRINPSFVRMPDSPSQDIRYAPLNQETRPTVTTDDDKKIPPSSLTESHAGADHNKEVEVDPSSQSMTLSQIQLRLSELGYKPGPADGKMGRNTVNALKTFQQDNGLSITGQADSETVSKLRQKTEKEVKKQVPQHAPIAEKPKTSAPRKTSSPTDL